MPENKDEQEQEGWNSPGHPVVETALPVQGLGSMGGFHPWLGK